MAANPIVVSKANQLFPEINFGFMTWLQGSIVPGLVCAACLPLLIRWSLGINIDGPKRGKHTRGGDNVVEHAKMELNKMGPVSTKELVSFCFYFILDYLSIKFCISNYAWYYWAVLVYGLHQVSRVWTLLWSLYLGLSPYYI
jgi:hypothetical protein